MDVETPPLTEEQRRAARAMAGLGVARRQIAQYLRIDEAALTLRLGDELDQAEVDANSKVAKALFTMATQKGNVAAAIFWMKARAGWREKQELDANVRTDMRAIHVVTGVPRPLDDMTDEELMRIAAGGRRRIAGRRDSDE